MNASALLLLLASPNASQSSTTLALAEAFYSQGEALNVFGLPREAEAARLSRYIDSSLLRSLEQARVKEDECSRLTAEGDKPPIWEGAIFTGAVEGASQVLSMKGRDADATTVEVKLVYVDDNFPNGHRYHRIEWQIALRMKPDGTGWKIYDLEFAEAPPLSQQIANYLQMDCDVDY
ncbi:hypothetical protein [Pseudomarimonas arenosa]|uniref:DUF3828 domain-containing protein n=1 Tax=Pseudomarimonas arenosa TaxID=2774145 RepID=A0AAW3ZQ18_9GAMM|nr:hypothetical protein [Pseudomarimonas arenosa]MBD8526386.1 hypothetical protein [Pseudomarimonas arenosa]